jgi:hypothetical protein
MAATSSVPTVAIIGAGFGGTPWGTIVRGAFVAVSLPAAHVKGTN